MLHLLAGLLAPLALAAAPALAPGEQLELDVDYLGLPVGKARLQVGRPEGGVLPVFLQARTSGLASIATIREQLATYLDLETGLPRSATLDAVEPGYHHSDRADFDRQAGQATVREVGTRDTTKVVPVPEGTVDFVALVFQLRALPLADGERHTFAVLGGTTVTIVVTQVVARETVRTDAGTFRAVKVRVPTTFGGQFGEKNPTFLWFSDDPRRILVKIVTEFRIGRATAELTRYQPGQPAAASPGP